jgi:uncharacterized protein YjbJ (UPF0337 family)
VGTNTLVLPGWHTGCFNMAGGNHMNWDQVEGKWKQVKGSFKERWGKFTDDDLDQLAGKRDQIVGKMQEKYGISKDQASKDLDAWRQNLKDEEQVRTSRSL